MSQAVFVYELLDGRGRKEGEWKCITPHLILDIGIIQRIDSCKLLVRTLNPMQVVPIGYQLELVEVCQLRCSKLSRALHLCYSRLIQKIGKFVCLRGNETLAGFIVEAGRQQHDG